MPYVQTRIINYMKNLIIMSVFLFGGITAMAQGGVVNVKVTNVEVDKGGSINLALYGKVGFLENGMELFVKTVKVTGEEAIANFEAVPAGAYAVAVYQDINENNNLDTKILGIPKEPVGFSKNKMGKMGPPDFDDVAFVLESGESKSLTIKMKNGR